MSAPSSLHGVRILVADDHASIREVVEPALAALGAEVTCVEDGGSALAWLHTGRFDVFLTDLHMPGIDGVGLIESAAGIDPHLPVIVMTGFATGERAEAAVLAGAVELIEKPFELQALTRAVEEASRAAVADAGTDALERITWWLEAEGVVRRADRLALPAHVAALSACAWGLSDPELAGAVATALAEARAPLRVRATVEPRTLTLWRMGETFPRLMRSRPDTERDAVA